MDGTDQGVMEPDTTSQWSVDTLRTVVDRRLRLLVPHAQIPPQQLHQAMCYSLLAPGKRLRPVLTLLASFHFGVRDLAALDAACALEMVHAASLIMDDLPAMDNAEMRRGQPTAHRQFGEEIAILAAVALLNQAYGVIGSMALSNDTARADLVRTFARVIGSDGLVGGQVIDLKERDQGMDPRRIEKLNELKTAALFVAAVEAGAIVAGATGDRFAAARIFATHLGLAFQIADDLLDDPAMAGQTGKDTGKDAGKPTVVSVLGPQGARETLDQHLVAARAALLVMSPEPSPLTAFFEASFAQLPAAMPLRAPKQG
jgi:geranylgeranyl diphosphate synthase, type II